MMRMPILRMTSLLIASLTLSCQLKQSATSQVADRDPLLSHKCYAPTKTLTEADKDAWIKKIIPAAKDAEEIYGVPASALVAMAAQEGGFGWTKAYLNSNNPFGYKWTSASQSENRPYFVLECQPKEDGNNKYIVFKNYWEATLYVGKRLSTMSRYKWSTDRYIKERRAGLDIKQAVDNWIKGIADSGYNYDPPAYLRDISSMANNYQSPSSKKSSGYNLYWLSANTSPKSK